MSVFDFSLGRNRFDVHPRRVQAPTLDEFARVLLAQRAPSKAAAGYISAAFGGDGRRKAANALPRAWLPMDVDAPSTPMRSSPGGCSWPAGAALAGLPPAARPRHRASA